MGAIGSMVALSWYLLNLQNVAKAIPLIFHWEPRAKAESAVVLETRAAAPPHQLEGLGSAVSSPSGVVGGDPTARRFSTILSTQDGLS